MQETYLMAEETIVIWNTGKKLFIEYHGTDRNGSRNFVHPPYYALIHEGFGNQKEYRTPVTNSLSEAVRAIYNECFRRAAALTKNMGLPITSNPISREGFKFWVTAPAPLHFENGIIGA